MLRKTALVFSYLVKAVVELFRGDFQTQVKKFEDAISRECSDYKLLLCQRVIGL